MFGSPIYNQWGLTEFPAATSLGEGDPPAKFEGTVGRTIAASDAWFDDPPHLAEGAGSEDEALSHYRRVRDEIRQFVAGLPDSLGPASSGR